MYQHPVPQNVTGYQFRLIGDMTIKQFLLLLSGVGVAVFFYLTNLFGPLKWLLIFGSVGFGGALAFIPIEERPLDQWLVAFFKAIYRPTHFIWQKNQLLPSYFTFVPSSKTLPADSDEIASAAALRKKQGILSYLQTLPNQESLTQLETTEQTQLEYIDKLLKGGQATPPPQVLVQTGKVGIDDTAKAAPPPIVAPSETVISTTPKPKPLADVSKGVVPTQAIKVAKTQTQKVAPAATTVFDSQNTQLPTPTATIESQEKINQTKAVTTNIKLPFPSRPKDPNVVVGMVLSPDQKIIEGAIIEIRDQNGIPVRATKTNKLGQFFSTTPLKNGAYEIEVEKDNLAFDILKLELKGDIIAPLQIQAKI